jgi:endonuclease YncB( thermonuclease family)
MGRPYQILYPLFSLFLVRVDLTDLQAVRMKVEILKVYDGDTVLVKRGFFQSKVRLTKIDAPEKTQNFLSGQKGAGELSKKCLVQMLGPRAELRIDGFDIYDRILGDLDGVSFKLVEKGCVSLYPHAKFENSQEKYLYLRALVKAKRLKRGLWAFGGIEQPKAWRKKNKSFRKRT